MSSRKVQYLTGPGILCEEDTLQHTLPGSCVHMSGQTRVGLK